MALPRALIEMAVEGAAESQRRIDSIGDALRRMNGESLERISGQVSSLGDRYSNLQSTIGNVVGFTVAGVSLGSLAARITGVMDSMAELDDLSQKIGTSVERLSQIQKVANAFGADFAGSIDPALVKLAKGLTTVDEKSSKTGKALAALGISANTLSDPGEIMVEVAKSLQQYEDGAAKAAIVNDLFGKSAADLLPFLNDLSGTVDGFSTISAESVNQVAALQDQFGMLGVRTNEAFEAVTAAALPALSGLAKGFADAIEAKDGLIDGGEIADWASMTAMGIARVADVGLLAVRTFSAISSSVQVVAADLKVLWTASPARMAYSAANGGSPLEELKKTVAERNQVLDAANKKLSDFYNARADVFSSKVASYLAPKVGDVAPGTPAMGPGKGVLSYKSGGDDAAKDADKQTSAYQNLVKAIQAKIAAADLELSAGAPLSASQQEQIKLTQTLAEMKGKLTPIQYALLESEGKELVTKLEVIEANARAAAGLESYTKSMAAYETSVAKAIENALTEASGNERLALTFGKTKGQIEALELARLEEQLAQRSSAGLTLDEIENLEKLIAAKKRSTAATGKIDTLTAGQKAAESLDEFLDPAKAQSFGEALRESLGGAGTALSALTSTLDGFGKRQAAIDEQRRNAALAYSTGQRSEMQNMQDLARLSEMETKNRLSGYGDMAGAAAGFFGEQSRGYQALMTVSKVFHAAELAMTMAELVPKGIAAVLNQGTGDPYSAFGRMAAMAAIVAGLGVAIGGVSGGSSVSLAESRQKEQGTGTVLGSDAKSGSIARALAQIEESTQNTLGVSNDMLISLRNIESGIGQFASLLVRTTGVTGDFGKELATRGSADAFGSSNTGIMATGGPIGMVLDKLTNGWVGKITGSVLGKIFGGKTTVEDTGFMLDKSSYGSILTSGVNASQYADIKKDGGWFSSDKNSTSTEALGVDGNRQIASILKSLYGTVYEAGTLLGLSADSFNAQLSSYVVDIGKVSFKGKTSDEIEEELQAVFSKVGDQLAEFGVGGLDQFQKVGEGYLETLARVASNYQGLDAIMASIGSTFGDTGIKSLDARERFLDMSGGIGELASQVSSFAENFLTEAERLAPVQKFVTDQLASIGMSWVDNSDEFKSAALGIDKTTEAGAKQFTVMMSLADAFAKVYPAAKDLSMSMTEIADQRSTLQDRLDEMTMTREQLLAKEAATVHATNRPMWDRIQVLQAEAAAQEKKTQERTTLQEQLDQLTMTREQLLARERAALDEGNRPLWDRIQALQAEKDAALSASDVAAGLMGDVDSAFNVLQRAVDRQRTAIQKQVATHTDAANRIRTVSDSLRSTINGMRGPGAEVIERTRAQSDLQGFLTIARAGGMLPDSDKLQAVLSVLTQDASAQFASFADYQADFYATKNAMTDLAAISDAALSTEERTLQTLEEQLASYDAMLEREQEQIDQLKGISTTGLSIHQAILALHSAVLSASSNPVNSSMSAITKAYESSLGRAPDAAGLEFWKDRASAGTSVSDIVGAISSSPEAKIKALYQSTFGRMADAGGLKFWMGHVASGMSFDTIEQALKGSDEYKAKTKTKIPGFAAGGSHAGGWRIVGEEGPELEATGPSRIFNAGQTQDLMRRLATPGEGSSAMVAEIRALRGEVVKLQEQARRVATATESTAGSSSQLAEQFENASDGGNAIRAEVINVVRTRTVV